jgi:hypothetical protein
MSEIITKQSPKWYILAIKEHLKTEYFIKKQTKAEK